MTFLIEKESDDYFKIYIIEDQILMIGKFKLKSYHLRIFRFYKQICFHIKLSHKIDYQ